jgi:hypothetical protein
MGNAMSRLFPALLLATVRAVAGARAHAAGLPTIYVDYKDDCTFQVTNDAHAPVSQMPAGTYQVAVSTGEPFGSWNLSAYTDLTACKGAINFRLTGPGISYFTTLDGGDSSFALYGTVFQTGTYTMQDDHNVAATRRTITVTAATPATTTPATTTTHTTTTPTKTATPAGPAVRGTLAGSVTTTGKLALTFGNKPVTTLATGRYKLSVLDETGRAAFTLQQAGKKATTITAKEFLGRHTLTLVLAPGKWTFYSTPGKKHTFVVTS